MYPFAAVLFRILNSTQPLKSSLHTTFTYFSPMSFDTHVRSPRESPPPLPSLEEVVGRLVDPPTDNSASQDRLDRIQQSSTSFEDMDEYEKHLKQAWDGTEHPDLDTVRRRLLGDAGRLIKLVKDQLALVSDSQALQEELQNAWSAAAANAATAREIFERVGSRGDEEELRRLRARVAELEAERSLKDIVAAQHKEVMEAFQAQTALSQGIKVSTDGIADKNVVAAQHKEVMDASQAQAALSQGIKATTDSIAAAVQHPSARQSKAQKVSDGRSPSGEREPMFAPERRGSAPSIRGRGLSQPSTRDQPSPAPPSSATRSNKRLSQSATAPTPSFQDLQPALGSLAPVLPFGFEPPGSTPATSSSQAPETPLKQPPLPSKQPLLSSTLHVSSVTNHTQVEDVFANLLAWDGDELFDISEIPDSLTDTLKERIKDKLCTIKSVDFDKALTSSIYTYHTACLWQRITPGKRDPNTRVGYHACPDCIRDKRPCLIRVQGENKKLPATRPYLAPLPDNIRPITATRRDLAYWIKP
jgi:hypothetical protein